MRVRYVRQFSILTLLTSVSLLSGCALFEAKDLVADGTTQVRVEASELASVVAPKVHQYGGQTYVEGKVLKSGPNRIVQGYVQVDVVDANGMRVDTAQTRYTFRHFGSARAKTAGFAAELAITPPPGSTVVIQHHDNRDEMQDGNGSLEIM